jgi:hypothetical protein
VATRYRKTPVAHPVEEEDGKGACEEGTLLGWEALPSLLLKLLGSSQGMCPKVSPGHCMLARGNLILDVGMQTTWGGAVQDSPSHPHMLRKQGRGNPAILATMVVRRAEPTRVSKSAKIPC